MRVVRVRVSFGLVSLCALIGALLVFSAPALAAAPEEPETKPATEVTNTTAILHGMVNPKTLATVSWFFEYNEGAKCTGGNSTPKEGPSEVEAEAAEAILSHLQPGREYTVCLVARNEEEENTVGNEVSFTTTAVPPVAPVISEESFSNVTASEATLTAQIDVEGSPATYKVEYGTSEPYSSSPEASLPAAGGAVSVLAHLAGLTPSTEYHFRFVVDNPFGETLGPELAFTTARSLGPSEMGLPDGRAYEMVSPVSEQEVYVPEQTGNAPEDITTARPFRASADGDAVAYLGEPPSSGEGGSGSTGKGAGNEYLATRSPQAGWKASDITPSNAVARYEAFSSNLSIGILSSPDLPPEFPALTGEVSENANLTGCEVLYSRPSDGDAFHALFDTTTTPGFCGGEINDLLFAGASADSTHQLLQSSAALTPEAEEALGEGKANLYDSVDGRLSLVNLVDGKPAPNATFGAPSDGGQDPPSFSNVISSDGSRIFWTDLNDGQIYARLNDERTIQLSAGAAKYWTATPDGHYAWYTEAGALWRFNIDAFETSKQAAPEALTAAREQLAGPAAEVQGVLGASSDGAYVYFVANGVLGNGSEKGATTQTCKQAGRNSPQEDKEFFEEKEGVLPPGRACNLYVYHDAEQIKFVAALSPKDNDLPLREQQGPDNGRRLGDWRSDIGSRTAEVTPDGRHLAFLSQVPLTGYNNLEPPSVIEPHNPSPAAELFNYDAATDRVVCASCDPNGNPPVDFRVGSPEPGIEGGAIVPVSFASTYMPRWLSADGSRIFFDTVEPLVAQDINRRLDVYEWEQNGTGSCKRDGGCIYLISRGDAPGASYLVDVSANGSDVFFTTRAALVASDEDAKTDLYDARENGGFPETSLACTGTGCQGVPPAPPVFATPSSVTFDGAGNFPPPPLGAIKPNPKSKSVKCRRGFVKKHGKCVKAKIKSKKKTKVKKAKKASAIRRGKS
jgi:hypothetical protein